MKKNIIFYSIILGLFVLLKLLVKQADNNDMQFLLSPLSYLISLFFGEKSIYSLEMGYFFQNMNITIDKGCSGFNFWMMSFVLSAFILIQLFGKWWKKLSLILLSFCLTYLVTIVVNFSRIVIAIFLQKTPFSFLHGKQIHLLEGGMIYLTTLVLIYLFLTNYILPVYEKSIES